MMAKLTLLAKKLAGWRTIGTCTTYYRLLLKVIAPEMRAWGEEVSDNNRWKTQQPQGETPSCA